MLQFVNISIYPLIEIHLYKVISTFHVISLTFENVLSN
jgi:hypothetical protein